MTRISCRSKEKKVKEFFSDPRRKENEKYFGIADSEFWIGKAQAELAKQTQKRLNTNLAKNVIFFLGDGMSVPTLTATRIYRSEINGKKSGEGEFLSFEEFPYTGLSRVSHVLNVLASRFSREVT